MILDYAYNKSKRVLSVSYIKENSGKGILNFNVDKFKTYYYTPNGSYENWDGAKCDMKWTEKPSTFDIKTYFEEMNPEYKELLKGKVSPKLYTFDIETEISDEFPEPSEAKFPITTISIANENCDVVVLGTKQLNDTDYLSREFETYIKNSEFFNSLNLKTPSIKYVQFDSEQSMLEYFLKNIVAKVPVLAGWNSIMFDWQYIQNRIRGYYPDLSLYCCSMNWTMSSKNYTDMRGDKVRLSMPNHTLILDMMDVVGNFDMVVMPIKESLSLDYIASESIGMNKIKYDGDLQKLFNEDYPKYVFYNAIDSVLVQLIDRKFKTLQNIYTQSLICKEKIGSCFSKIALSEALFFNYFYDHNIKIVPTDNYTSERGTLVGAYVATPVPGKHEWVTCNDFASLYPSVIRTCNLSIENFVGSFYDEEKLKPYKEDTKNYMVVGGTVYKNKGTHAKPELGDFICNCFLEDELDVYRKDKNYFVSVNGHVYKNDKDYSFKSIQQTLANNRNKSKYLAKQLDATIVRDIEHIFNNIETDTHKYQQNIIDAISNMGWEIDSSLELHRLNKNDLEKLFKELKDEIKYLTSFEQACKLLMNSLYGGSSHVAFAFFKMELANDITGESRNLIHLMEKHIPEFFKENWFKLEDLHKKLGIKLKPQNIKTNKSLAEVVAGDTDSIYLSYKELLNTIDGIENMSPYEIGMIIARLNTEFLDDHNCQFMEEYYNTRHCKSVHRFELETIAYSECRLDVKKRYAQILFWKDGKVYEDVNSMPLKVKGLEMVKSSYPKQAREGLKRIVRYFLEDQSKEYLLQRLNIEMQKEKELWMLADIEDICENKGVQNYTKYILDDNSKFGLQVAPKCPYNVRALGNYNYLRNVYDLPGDPIYGGKMKIYQVISKAKKADDEFFAFQSRNYPAWAEQYAPIDKNAQFRKYFLEPFNRILNAVGVGELNTDGSIQMSLF